MCNFAASICFVTKTNSADIFFDWHVALNFNSKPVSGDQLVEIVSFNLFILLYFFIYLS